MPPIHEEVDMLKMESLIWTVLAYPIADLDSIPIIRPH